ncbi:MAG: adenosylhomocysteinase, partial [Chloroflexota bacterium]
VKDTSLNEEGRQRIDWAARHMPVIALIRERFTRETPLQDVRISACLHVTAETANLMLALRDAGARLVLCASNPLSTQDDVAAALVEQGVAVNAIRGEDEETYYRHIETAIAHRPQITLDDGADLVSTIHQRHPQLVPEVYGGTEETTTGVIRLKNMARAGKLGYPIIAVNNARTKHLFDNRYGTGQSTVDGITRATNILWAGRRVVVCGYGWCGRGIASRARGLGANVIVTEVDPIAALEAVMDGYSVMPLAQAAEIGEVFVTATGNTDVLDSQHIARMKDGAILANSGHFNVEINVKTLEDLAVSSRAVRPSVREFTLKDGRRVYLLGEGRLINLAAAEGHPASVMDMSFSNQALCVEHLLHTRRSQGPQVYEVPEGIDREVGRLKLASMGVHIDSLTEKQRQYLASWESGT